MSVMPDVDKNAYHPYHAFGRAILPELLGRSLSGTFALPKAETGSNRRPLPKDYRKAAKWFLMAGVCGWLKPYSA